MMLYLFRFFKKSIQVFFLLDNTSENEWYAKKDDVLWQKIRHLTSMNDHELLQTTYTKIDTD